MKISRIVTKEYAHLFTEGIYFLFVFGFLFNTNIKDSIFVLIVLEI